jgi:hypothetical protein
MSACATPERPGARRFSGGVAVVAGDAGRKPGGGAEAPAPQGVEMSLDAARMSACCTAEKRGARRFSGGVAVSAGDAGRKPAARMSSCAEKNLVMVQASPVSFAL